MEYVNSLYNLSKAYNILEDNRKEREYLEMAYMYIVQSGLLFKSNDLFISYAYNLLESENREQFTKLMANEYVLSLLDERGLLEFQIIMNQFDILEIDRDLIVKIDKNINICIELGYNDFLSQLYYIKADYLEKVEPKQSISIYRKILELDNTLYKTKSLVRLGLLEKNSNYMDEAYLLGETLNNYELRREILEASIKLFTVKKLYKKLYIAYERLNYYNKQHYIKMLDQYKKNNEFGYEISKLKQINKFSIRRIEILYIAIIILGIIILTLLTFLSIQTYRIRHH